MYIYTISAILSWSLVLFHRLVQSRGSHPRNPPPPPPTFYRHTTYDTLRQTIHRYHQIHTIHTIHRFTRYPPTHYSPCHLSRSSSSLAMSTRKNRYTSNPPRPPRAEQGLWKDSQRSSGCAVLLLLLLPLSSPLRSAPLMLTYTVATAMTATTIPTGIAGDAGWHWPCWC